MSCFLFIQHTSTNDYIIPSKLHTILVPLSGIQISTRVALMSAPEVQKVIRQTEWVQGCLHQTLSVPPHSLPTISKTNT